MGYGEIFRKDVLKEWKTGDGKIINRTHEDIKPEINEMIKWI